MKKITLQCWLIFLLSLYINTSSFALEYNEVKLIAPDGHKQQIFGWSVAVHSGFAAVSAPNPDGIGSVYLFKKNQLDNWVFSQKISPSPELDTRLFGQTIALSQHFLAISTLGSDDLDKGAVLVYHRVGNSWSFVTTLYPPTNAGLIGALDFDKFGGRLIVGDTGNQGKGAAYIYRPLPNAWFLEQSIIHPTLDTSDLFGQDVSINGGLALIGASRDDDSKQDAGAAYLYQYKNATSDWQFLKKLKPGFSFKESFFGHSVSLDDSSNILAIGAPHDSQATTEAGAVYLFRPEEGNWLEQEKIIASDATAREHFGSSLDMNYQQLIIGSPENLNLGTLSGAAYHFEKTTPGDLIEKKFIASDTQQSENYGFKVDKDTAGRFIVGAPRDNPSGINSGSAYLYEPIFEESPFDVDIVLAPWPYIYIYTGYVEIIQNQTAKIKIRWDQKINAKIALIGNPRHGEAKWDSKSQNLIYSPNKNKIGRDQMVLSIKDEKGCQNQLVVDVEVFPKPKSRK